MGRPLIGDKPLTAAEKTKRHRQKLRQLHEQPPPPSSEPSAEDLKQARREISALQLENDRLRAEAGLTVVSVPPQDASPPAPIMAEEVEADDGPPTSIWAAVKRAEQLRKAGKPL
jgi:hypothetical protein